MGYEWLITYKGAKADQIEEGIPKFAVIKDSRDDENGLLGLSSEASVTLIKSAVPLEVQRIEIAARNIREVQRIKITTKAWLPEVQIVEATGPVKSGTFRLRFGYQYTAQILFTATEDEMANALSELQSLHSVTVTRIPSGSSIVGPIKWEVTFDATSSDFATMDVDKAHVISGDVIVREKRAGVAAEVQKIRLIASGQISGHFECSFDGSASVMIPFDSDAISMALLLESLVGIGTLYVKRQNEDVLGGSEWVVTFKTKAGNLPLLVCSSNLLNAEQDDAIVVVEQMIAGAAETLSGNFFLGLGQQEVNIDFDSSALDIENFIEKGEGGLGVDDVSVSLGEIDENGGREWFITFISPTRPEDGQVLTPRIISSTGSGIIRLKGTGANVAATVVVKGTDNVEVEPVGNFTLAFAGAKVAPLSCNATDAEVANALSELSTHIGEVAVDKHMVAQNGFVGYAWDVTFLTKQGDIPIMDLNASLVSTHGELLSVVTEVKKTPSVCCSMGSFSLYVGAFSEPLPGTLTAKQGSAYVGTSIDLRGTLKKGDSFLIGSEVHIVHPLNDFTETQIPLERSFDSNSTTTVGYLRVSTPFIPNNASALELQGAIESLLGPSTVNVEVISVDSNQGSTWTIEFSDYVDVDGNVAPMVPIKGTYTGILEVETRSDSAQSEIQSVTLSASSSIIGGFFKLTYDGEETVDIPFDSSWDGMKAALEGLSNIDEVDVYRDGPSPAHGFSWRIAFKSNSGDLNTMGANAGGIKTVATSDADVTVNEVRKGNSLRLGGTFRLVYDGQNGNNTYAIDGTREGGKSFEDDLRTIFPAVEVSPGFSDFNNGYEWFVTFDQNDTAGIEIDTAGLTGTLPYALVTEVTKGSTLGGTFSLHFGASQTPPLPFNADANAVEAALEQLPLIDDVTVELIEADKVSNLYSWRVTFASEQGSLGSLESDSSGLDGTFALASVTSVVRGHESVHGTFSLSFEGDSTERLSHDISSEDLRVALEQLHGVGSLTVVRSSTSSGVDWLISFTSLSEPSNIGNIAEFQATSFLTGSNAFIMVSEIQSGCCSLDVTLDGQLFSGGGFFRYDSTAYVAKVSPTSGETRGGTAVTVEGNGFHVSADGSHTYCLFGIVEVPAVVLTENMIECVSPPQHEGSVLVKVIYRSLTSGIDEPSQTIASFTYTVPIVIDRAYPALGPAAGNTAVTVHGSGFLDSPTLFCIFDFALAPATFLSASEVICTAPASTVNTKKTHVTVTNNGIGAASTTFPYRYIEDAIVTQVSPMVGPIGGGTVVQLGGVNFEAEGIMCRFGSAASIPAKWINAQLVTCVSPPFSPADVSQTITVWSATGGFFSVGVAVLSDQLVPVPFDVEESVLSSALESVLPLNWRTEVFRSFDGGSYSWTVRLSSTSVSSTTPLLIVDGTSLVGLGAMATVDSRQRQSGRLKVSLSVTNNDQDLSASTTFEYHEPLVVSKLSTTTGPISGGTRVIVLLAPADVYDAGAFEFKLTDSGVVCRFGQTSVTGFVIGAKEVECFSPAHAEGDVNVEVSLNNEDFTNDGVAFTFHSPVRVLAVLPQSGPVNGGTLLTVRGEGFLGMASEMRCKIGNVIVPVVFATSFSVQCRTPTVSGRRQVNVQVSNNAQDFTHTDAQFTYDDEAHVASVIPAVGPSSGGTPVVVEGGVFRGGATDFGLQCRFGDQIVPAVWFGSDRVGCVSPALRPVREIQKVQYTRGGVMNSADSTFQLFYISQCYSGDVALCSNYSTASINLDAPSSAIKAALEELSIVGKVDVSMTDFNEGSEWLVTFLSVIGDVPLLGIMNAPVLSLEPDALVVREVRKGHSSASGIVAVEVSSNGLDFTTSGVLYEYEPNIQIAALYPKHGPMRGGTRVLVTGEFFTDSSSLFCRFGNIDSGSDVVGAEFINSTCIVCVSPASRRSGEIALEVSHTGAGLQSNFSESGVLYVYDELVKITYIEPSQAPVSGGTAVHVFGKNFLPTDELKCQFGTWSVPATWINSEEVVCFSPPHTPGSYPFEITCNDQDYTSDGSPFFFYEDPIVERLMPVSGPSRAAGTRVTVYGKNFVNSSSLGCRFGMISVPALYIRSTEIECNAPVLDPSQMSWLPLHAHRNIRPDPNHGNNVLFPGAHDYPTYLSKLVPVEITNNDQDYTNGGIRFLYQEDASVEFVTPNAGYNHERTPMFVFGSGFVNSSSLVCRVGHRVVSAVFLSPLLALCFSTTNSEIKPLHGAQVPLPPLGYILPSFEYEHGLIRQTDFMHADSAAVANGPNQVIVEVSNNGVDFTSGQRNFSHLGHCSTGYYCLEGDPTSAHICPSGTFCPGEGRTNFTLCPRGAYQPSIGAADCLRCPIGYCCPDEGMHVPRLCPAGFVCDVTGTEFPSMPCPEGHFCLAGTATTATTCGSPYLSSRLFPTASHAELANTVRPGRRARPPSFVLGARNSACWSNSTHDFGLQTSPYPERFWKERHLLPLDPHTPFKAMRGRYCLDDACMRLTDFDNVSVSDYAFDYSSTDWSLRRPVACPPGQYCPPGTAVDVGNMKNFSTPQPCSESMYCPEGSTSPQGAGDCPAGFYCPFSTRIPCPVGTYCPKAGHTAPLPCPPKSFNGLVGQTQCTVCPAGFICPGFGRVDPAACPPGFICSTPSLSSPNTRCPAGYYCLSGTLTTDPFRNDTTLRPYPCPPGTYCLGGVGNSTVVTGYYFHAQWCTKGFYCELASTSPKGNGLCPKGFTCPLGTGVPIPTSPGKFADIEGAVSAATCLPGYYAPTIETTECYRCPPGTECANDASAVATICPPGKFRARGDPTTDGVMCMGCPQGRWSKNWELRDESECTVCPPGTSCPVDGMTNPCSWSDLPEPYKPTGMGESMSICLKKGPNHFYGYLLCPVDSRGRGPNFERSTDPVDTPPRASNCTGYTTGLTSLGFKSQVQCYKNDQPFGSPVYQRLRDYHGPRYEIQTGGKYHQGYGDELYEGFYGRGSHHINLPVSRTYFPGRNCTSGYKYFDEKKGIDVWEEGTCEADVFCDREGKPEAQACLEGYVCDVQTNALNALAVQCPEGYTCGFGTTPDNNLVAPMGRYKKLCDAGYFCPLGTGLGQAKTRKCRAGYFCPTGTADPLTGLTANDALKRGVSELLANPFTDTVLQADQISVGSGVLWDANFEARNISAHDFRCFQGINETLRQTFQERKDSQGRYDGMVSLATEADLHCGRDHRWRLVSQAMFRQRCECNAQVERILKVYRLWKCKRSATCTRNGLYKAGCPEDRFEMPPPFDSVCEFDDETYVRHYSSPSDGRAESALVQPTLLMRMDDSDIHPANKSVGQVRRIINGQARNTSGRDYIAEFTYSQYEKTWIGGRDLCRTQLDFSVECESTEEARIICANRLGVTTDATLASLAGMETPYEEIIGIGNVLSCGAVGGIVAYRGCALPGTTYRPFIPINETQLNKLDSLPSALDGGEKLNCTRGQDDAGGLEDTNDDITYPVRCYKKRDPLKFGIKFTKCMCIEMYGSGPLYEDCMLFKLRNDERGVMQSMKFQSYDDLKGFIFTEGRNNVTLDNRTALGNRLRIEHGKFDEGEQGLVDGEYDPYQKVFNVQRMLKDTGGTTYIDPLVYDLWVAVNFVDEYKELTPRLLNTKHYSAKKVVDGLVEDVDALQLNRLDVCSCQDLLQCPDGTTSADAVSSIFQCIKTGDTSLMRVMPLNPSKYTDELNMSGWQQTATLTARADKESIMTDYTDLNTKRIGFGFVDLKGWDVATVTVDLTNIVRNLTYGSHYQLSIYVNEEEPTKGCLPCVVRFECSGDNADHECCSCNRYGLPHFFVDTYSDPPSFPDNKHQIVQVSLGAMQDVRIYYLFELLHGMYYGEFMQIGPDDGHVSIHTPSRASCTTKIAEGGEATYYGATYECDETKPLNDQFLAVIKSEDLADYQLPLNLPFPMKAKDYYFEGSPLNGIDLAFQTEEFLFVDRIALIDIGDPTYNKPVENSTLNETENWMSNTENGTLDQFDDKRLRRRLLNSANNTSVNKTNVAIPKRQAVPENRQGMGLAGVVMPYVSRDPSIEVKRDVSWWSKVIKGVDLTKDPPEPMRGVNKFAMTYLPFFSNCRGYDSHIYLSKLLEVHPGQDTVQYLNNPRGDAGCTHVPRDQTAWVSNYMWHPDNGVMLSRDKIRTFTDSCRMTPEDAQALYPKWGRSASDWPDSDEYASNLKSHELDNIPGMWMSCVYEEEIFDPPAQPRWFEAPVGTNLFYISANPVPYDAWSTTTTDTDVTLWGRTKELDDLFESTESLVAITLSTDSLYGETYGTEKNYITGISGDATIVPRLINLELFYFQRSVGEKKIVRGNLFFSDDPAFLCTTADNEQKLQALKANPKGPILPCTPGDFNYILAFKWEALMWDELMNNFMLEPDMYIVVFSIVGLATIFAGASIWASVRVTSRLKHPPTFKFLSLMRIVSWQPLQGVVLCSIPPMIACGVIYVWFTLLNNPYAASKDDFVGINFDDQRGDYKDATAKTDDEVNRILRGRTGTALIIVGCYMVILGATMFVPDHFDDRASDDIRQEEADRDQEAYDDDEEDEVVVPSRFWTPRLWKRSHMIQTSFFLMLLLLFVWEFSYSSLFEDYVNQFIILFKISQMFIDLLLAYLLRENLMCAPLLIVVEITEIVVTMGASDFMDFLIGYSLGLGMMILERIILDPKLKEVMKLWPKWRMQIKRKFAKRRNMTREQRAREEAEWKKINEEIALESEGVEPLLDSYAVYANELEALFLVFFVNIFLFVFKVHTEIPANYSIKETDLKYYIIFAFVIIPFTLASDMFLLNTQEIAWGWKLYDYVSYQNYRFSVRECRWQMKSETLDESIAEPLQSIDMMCFSSQYYFMSGTHAWGMLLFMWGLTCHLRVDFNMFQDPHLLVLIPLIYMMCSLVQWGLTKLANLCRLWMLKSLEGTIDDDIAAKLAIGEGRQEDLEAERLELQAMNSDRFRHRFLERSRPWVLQHLTELLTPRTLQMPGPDGRPNIEYIRDVYMDLMNMGEGRRRPGDRADISSDDEDDGEAQRREWSKAPIVGTSAAIAKWWLQKARQRRVLMKLVRGYITNATLDYCQLCGRTEASGAEMRADLALDAQRNSLWLATTGKADSKALDNLVKKYEETYPNKEFDGNLWQSFFRGHATFVTRCSVCIDQLEQARLAKAVRHPGAGRAARAIDISSDEDEEDIAFEPMVVARSSVEGRVMTKWLVAARKRLGGSFPRAEARKQMEEYAKRMRDIKARGGKGRKKKSQRRGKGGESDQPASFGQVRLSAATSAILTLWIRKAHDSIIVREREKASKLRAEVDSLLEQMPEDQDWYYSSEMRLAGGRIQEEGKTIQEERNSLDAAAAVKTSQADHEFDAFSREMHADMDSKNAALDQQMQEERRKAMDEAEIRVQELTKQKTDTAAAFAKEEKMVSQAERVSMIKIHRAELAALEEAIGSERERQLAKVEQRLAKRRAELRQELTQKERQIATRKRATDKAKNAALQEVIQAIKPKEVKWQAMALVWLEKARRKIAMKKKEDEEQEAAAAKARKRP